MGSDLLTRRSARAFALAIAVASLIAPLAGQNRPYAIGPDDVLVVTVFNQPELTGRFSVGADGAVALPMIGRVPAAGLTPRELETSLTTKLSQSVLRNPQVTVSIGEYRSQQFFVVGEVRQPGTFFLSGQETLIQAIARAGYTTPEAGSEVLIVRPRQRAATSGPVRPDQADANDVVRVSLDRLTTGVLDDNVAIQDGDTIFVPKAETVYILGQVKAPGGYRLSRTLTVLQLLSMAGGVTERGDMRRIKITRLVQGKKIEIKGGLNDLVSANDTVTVPERWF